MELEKHLKILELLQDINDIFIYNFFNINSNEMLDEKIEVLTALKEGKVPADIPNYYKILELYPKNEYFLWD